MINHVRIVPSTAGDSLNVCMWRTYISGIYIYIYKYIIYIYIFFFFKTLPPTIMVQWKMGVYPILVSFHSGDPFSTSMGVFGYQPESMPTAGP